MIDPITKLANAIMTGVVATDVIKLGDDLARPIAIIRAELKEFVCGEKYAYEREAINTGAVAERTVLASIVADCVLQIKAAA